MRQDLWTEGLWGGFAEFSGGATRHLLVIAPFVTRRALEALLHSVAISDVTVVTTWEPRDVIRGASDPGIYAYLRSRGWRLLLRPGLHAKLLVADWRSAVISTANITEAGLGMRQPPNLECALPIECLSERDQLWLFAVLSESRVVTDDFYSAFTSHLSSLPRDASLTVPAFDPPRRPDGDISLSDFPASASPEELVGNLGLVRAGQTGSLDPAIIEATLHDVQMFSINVKSGDAALTSALREPFFALPATRRLRDFMQSPRFFGEVKRWLRTQPSISRASLVDVTRCTQRLFAWFSAFGQTQYLLTRPRYSQCLVPFGKSARSRANLAERRPSP